MESDVNTKFRELLSRMVNARTAFASAASKPNGQLDRVTEEAGDAEHALCSFLADNADEFGAPEIAGRIERFMDDDFFEECGPPLPDEALRVRWTDDRTAYVVEAIADGPTPNIVLGTHDTHSAASRHAEQIRDWLRSYGVMK